MNNKDLLDMKNEQELKEVREKRSSTYSIMEDFYNIILLKDYDEVDVQKMLNTKNLLVKLADLWIDDERVLALQEKILQEFLQL